MKYGIQIASLLFMITIVFNYFRHKRLPLQSTRFFTGFIIVAIINLFAEGLTLLTINNLDVIPSILNRFTHQLFIASLDLIILMLYLYIDLKCRNQKKYSKQEIIIRLIPFMISVLIIIFGKLEYYVGQDGAYSHGMMANTIYGSVSLYLIFTIISIIKNKKRFTNQEIITIAIGILSWTVISIIQLLKPTLLLSSLGIVLMVQFLYMSFENSDKYLTVKDGCVFSKNAFKVTVSEYLLKNNLFYIVNLFVANYDVLAKTTGYDEINSTINESANELSKKIKGIVFISKDSTISIITENEEEYDKLRNDRIKLDDKEGKFKIIKKGIIVKDYKSFDEIVSALEKKDDVLTGYKDNKSFVIPINEIYYVEVIDNQSFIYTKKNCYESKDKLYKLEEALLPWDFVRCSKSMLCNIRKVTSIEKETNSRMIAYLSNEESIIISRQYVKDFKSKINM